jgi:hypothetical protein
MAMTKARPILVRMGTERAEKMGALANTPSTRRNGQKMGVTQAMICASLKVTMGPSMSACGVGAGQIA